MNIRAGIETILTNNPNHEYLISSIFHAQLADYCPEYTKERQIMRSAIDDSILSLLLDTDKTDIPSLSKLHLLFENKGLADQWIDFILSSFGFNVEGANMIIPVPAQTPDSNPTTGTPSELYNSNMSPLLRRAFLALEENDFSSADSYLEAELNQNPESPYAYLGKLLSECNIDKPENLKNCPTSFIDSTNYKRIVRFGSEDLKKELKGYLDEINDRNTKNQKQLETLVLSVVESIKKKRNGVSKDELELALTKAQSNKQHISFLMQNYDRMIENAKEMEISNQSLRTLIDQLKEQKRHLGLFAVKEKKAIEEVIHKTEQSIADSEQVVSQTKLSLKGYSNKAQIRDALMTAEQEIAKLQNELSQYNNPLSGAVAYEDALRILDTNEQVRARVFSQYNDIALFIARKGDIVEFGCYPQNKKSSIKLPIKWKVLQRTNNDLLLIAHNALDCVQYHNVQHVSITWEMCTLRKWLNTTFLSIAFSLEEQKLILNSRVFAYDKSPNPESWVQPGRDTVDKVFLLSCTEIKRYWNSDEDYSCIVTDYAKEKQQQLEDSDVEYKWLRGTEDGCNFAPTVHGKKIEKLGRLIWTNNYIQPVIYIRIQ